MLSVTPKVLCYLLSKKGYVGCHPQKVMLAVIPKGLCYLLSHKVCVGCHPNRLMLAVSPSESIQFQLLLQDQLQNSNEFIPRLIWK